jgi:hypothetical protein
MTVKDLRGQGFVLAFPPIYNYLDQQPIVCTERGQADARRVRVESSDDGTSGDEREDLGEE